MRWVPPWLARAYARLYATKRNETFGFPEAGTILQIKDERSLAKTLAKLKTSGCLTVRRDPIDPRRKLFKLVDPESLVLAMAIQSQAKSVDLTGKLSGALRFLDYYVNGAYAAYQYHRYSAPGRIDLSVRADQIPTWTALLSEKDTAISVDEMPAEKPAKVNIHLRSDFDEKLSESTWMIDGVRYLSPEALVVLGIARDSPSVEDTLAILIVQRTSLDWKKLVPLSEAYNAMRFLGCILDVVNFEWRKPLFPKSQIDRIFRQSDLRARVDFPSSLRTEPIEPRYESVASKWNLRLHLSHAVVSKVITDLVRA